MKILNHTQIDDDVIRAMVSLLTKTLKDLILPRLKQFQALEERKDSQEKIIEMEPRG